MKPQIEKVQPAGVTSVYRSLETFPTDEINKPEIDGRNIISIDIKGHQPFPNGKVTFHIRVPKRETIPRLNAIMTGLYIDLRFYDMIRSDLL